VSEIANQVQIDNLATLWPLESSLNAIHFWPAFFKS